MKDKISKFEGFNIKKLFFYDFDTAEKSFNKCLEESNLCSMIKAWVHV